MSSAMTTTEDRLELLQADNARLREQIQVLERDNRRLERERDDALQGYGEVRQALSPLYRGLQKVFGEFEAAGLEDTSASGRSTSSKWDDWKKRLDPSSVKVIDALIVGGEMGVEGLRLAARMSPNTVYVCLARLQKMGVVVKTGGGKYSLKQ